jgi:hypothetical protein
MRTTFTFPASYRRAVEAALAIALADIARDQKYRSADDERIRQYASVPDALIDTTATGELTALLVETESNGNGTTKVTTKAAVSTHS